MSTNILNKYLKSEQDTSNWSNFFFDFDNVLILFNRNVPDKIMIPYMRIMTKRKKEKKNILVCAKELGYKNNLVMYIFSELYKYSTINKKLVQHIIELKKTNPDKKFYIASNNTVNFINYILLKYNMANFFDFVFTPESLKWNWKPDKKYFTYILDDLHMKSFESSLLIDDEIENIDMFKKLGGNGFHYKKAYPK